MTFRSGLVQLALLGLLAGCSGTGEATTTPGHSSPTSQAREEQEMTLEEIQAEVRAGRLDAKSISDAQWRAALSDEEYYVTRQEGTEPARSNEYWDCKTPGVYECRCCGLPLFDSKTKYASGTGWPSFYDPIDKESVRTKEDRRLWAVRTEVLCSRCDAHLGHVFNDGPPPTGLRYCMNSASLKLIPDESEKSDQQTSDEP